MSFTMTHSRTRTRLKPRHVCACFSVPPALLLTPLLILGTGNAAAVETPRDTLTLAQATQLTLQRNPQLAVSGYALKIDAARIDQAGLGPNPHLSVELEDFLGTGAVSGVKSLQTTLSLSQVIELGNKRQLRIHAANGSRDLNAIEQQARQLDVLAETTRRFITVVAAQEKLRLAQQAVTLSETSLQTIEARVQAARAPEAERGRARIALTRAQLQQQDNASALQGARQSLASMWGDGEARFMQAGADLFSLPALHSYAALAQQLQNTPDFIRFATQGRLREAELRLAQAQARPDLTLSLGVRRLEASDDTALVAGFSIPLRWHDRNQGNIREAELRRERTAAEQQAAQVQAQALLYSLYQQITTSRARLATLRDTAIPQARQVLEQTRYGYERGRFSYLELLSAQSELLELQGAAIDAAADSQLLLTEIERLTSTPLVTTP